MDPNALLIFETLWPGIQVLGVLVFAWCFIVSAALVGFRLAQRPRRAKRVKPMRIPESWTAAPQEPYSPQTMPRSHRRYGNQEIKPAPGPRDWTPGL